MRTVLVLLVCLASIVAAQTVPAMLTIFDTKAGRGALPDGWQLKVNSGKPEVSWVADSRGRVLHLRSRASSFSLEREMDVDVTRYPFLEWRWKVLELPKGGDFRRHSTDDQAAQLLVLFSDRRVLCYIWDSSAPQGLIQAVNSVPWLHIAAVVVRSGSGEANTWLAERRNVAADYAKAFGRPAAHVKGVRLQINSQHTGTSAESEFGEVVFRQ